MRILFYILFITQLAYGQRMGSPVGVNPIVANWRANCTNKTTPKVLCALNYFTASSLAHGDWLEYDRFWLFAQDDQINAKRSIINPTSSIATEVNSPSFSAYGGYTGNGTNSCVNCNWVPSTDGVKFTKNSSTQLAYALTAGKNELGALFGCRHFAAPTTGMTIVPSGTVAGFLAQGNNNTNLTAAGYTRSDGMFMTIRTSSTSLTGYANGSSIGTDATATVGLVDVSMFACADNSSGSFTLGSTNQVAILAVGSGSIGPTTSYNDIQHLAILLGFNR